MTEKKKNIHPLEVLGATCFAGAIMSGIITVYNMLPNFRHITIPIMIAVALVIGGFFFMYEGARIRKGVQ